MGEEEEDDDAGGDEEEEKDEEDDDAPVSPRSLSGRLQPRHASGGSQRASSAVTRACAAGESCGSSCVHRKRRPSACGHARRRTSSSARQKDSKAEAREPLEPAERAHSGPSISSV